VHGVGPWGQRHPGACQRADRFLLRVSRNRRGFFLFFLDRGSETNWRTRAGPRRDDGWWVDQPARRSVAGDLNHLRWKSSLKFRTSSRIRPDGEPSRSPVLIWVWHWSRLLLGDEGDGQEKISRWWALRYANATISWQFDTRKKKAQNGGVLRSQANGMFGFNVLKFNSHHISVAANAWNTKCRLIACILA